MSTKAALLLALQAGPDYGADLIRRVREKTSEQVRLGRGNVYPVLRSLERRGLVRTWQVVPGGRRGSRARVYYELTPKGIAVAEAQRSALAGLVVPPSTMAPSTGQVALMRERLRRCAELSAFVSALRQRMREASV